MVIVTLPTGLQLRYQSAHFVERLNNGRTALWTKNGGSFIAEVPPEAVVAFYEESFVGNVMATTPTLEAAIDKVLNEVGGRMDYSTCRRLARLKKHLNDHFNAKTMTWTD